MLDNIGERTICIEELTCLRPWMHEEKSEIVDQLFASSSVIADMKALPLRIYRRPRAWARSSLYHHFPRGKEQMAEAVLEQGKAFIQSAIADVARSGEPLHTRIGKISASLDQMYAGGHNACVLGRLAAADIGAAGHQIVRDIFELWATAIAELARDSGMSPTHARQFAEDWIARLQGSLILHSASGDRKPFERALSALTQLAEPKVSTTRPKQKVKNCELLRASCLMCGLTQRSRGLRDATE